MLRLLCTDSTKQELQAESMKGTSQASSEARYLVHLVNNFRRYLIRVAKLHSHCRMLIEGHAFYAHPISFSGTERFSSEFSIKSKDLPTSSDSNQ